jgi:hypothetical protein
MGRKAVTPVKKTNFDVKAFHDSIVQAHKDSLKSEYKRKKSFAPSTVGYGHGKCPRYWYYAFSGTEFADKNDYKSLSNMANGRDAHERIQKIIDKTPYNVVVEQEALSSDPPIRGFIDLELVDFNVPVEIKTTNDDQYRLHKVSGTVSPSHKVQTLIYMKIRGASEGIVMYENKNSHEIHMVPVVMTPANSRPAAFLPFTGAAFLFAFLSSASVSARPSAQATISASRNSWVADGRMSRQYCAMCPRSKTQKTNASRQTTLAATWVCHGTKKAKNGGRISR